MSRGRSGAIPARLRTIDEYLARVGADKRAALQKLRRDIREAAPKAEECISYKVPALRLDGRTLVHFGAATNHCAFYPGAHPIDVHQDELAAYETTKGTIRFQADSPLPATLVRKLVRTRIEEYAARRPSAARGGVAEPRAARAGEGVMADDLNVLLEATSKALSGRDAHVEAKGVFAGLDWKLAGARPEGVPHTLFQLANHMTYWQEWVVKWLDGEKPRAPRHAAASWTGRGAPANRSEWNAAVQRFRASLSSLERHSRRGDLRSKRGRMTRLEVLRVIGSHTSYHVGQAAFLRQVLGAWPPPSGGVTW